MVRTNWVEEGAAKLDEEVRRRLLEDVYRPPRRGGRLLHNPVVWWRERTRKVKVIIRMESGFSTMERRSVATELRRKRCRDVRDLELVDAVSARVPVGRLRELAGDSRVRKISLDREVRAFLDIAAPAVGAPLVWDAGATGKGVTVAVIDTGIAPHPDLTGPTDRIVAFKDFIGNRSEPYDDNGHGTHIAGIIAGSGEASGGRYRGIAPDAKLVGVKVLDRMGRGDMSKVIEGIQWVIRHKQEYGIRILSLSLGALALEGYQEDPVAGAAEAAWKAGLIVCVAAGNDGPRKGSIATPGIHPELITVGASDDHRTPGIDNDTVAPFSSRGPTVDGLTKPDLLMPGVNIISAAAAGSVIARRQGAWRAKYLALSGTSMATPICAGVAALLLERNPGLAPAEVKELLVGSARSLGLDPNDQGAGIGDAAGTVLGGRRAERGVLMPLPLPDRLFEAAEGHAEAAAAGEDGQKPPRRTWLERFFRR